MDLTPEQRAAVTIHDRNLIVTAGAGSGKTRVLVERFLALLDAHPDWPLPSIVAITFTEKAAAEMLSRVRAAIEERIRADAAARDERSLTRWLEHRAALARARIGTIHSLCAAILRANSAEAVIDPDFEVLDEADAGLLLDDAVETALARLTAEDRPGAQILALYDVRDVRAVLGRYARRGAAADVARALNVAPETLVARWQADWADSAQETMQTALSDAALQAALGWIAPEALPPDDKLADLWRAVFAQEDALFSGDPVVFAATVDALAEGIKLNVGSAKAWGDKDTVSASKAALGAIRDWAKAVQKDSFPAPADADADAANLLMGWRDVIALGAEVYDALKSERGVLDFDDLEARAHDLLEYVPAVAERYAHPVNGEIRQLLVDEFQDTNTAQRDIIYRLAGLDGGESGGQLFVVGDPKQSIYAFRGADVSVFAAVRDDLLAWGGVELPLSTSFRAHAPLVDAFNDVFGHILTPGSGPTARYEVDRGVPMQAARPGETWHAAPLRVIAIRQPGGDGPRLSADDKRRWEAWEVAAQLHELVSAKTPVWDRDARAYRPARYGDMALLFQAMGSVTLYEDVFKATGLPYLTIAGRGYYDRPEVWDLLNLLAALRTPGDDLALAVALRSPLFGLSDDALLALRLARDPAGEPLTLWDALRSPDAAPLFPDDERPPRDFACVVLAELRAMAGRATVAEVLARALDLTGLLAALTGLASGARRRGNVEKLLGLARESGRVALGAFLDYARDLTAREVREGEAAVEAENAVKLMTVHASKGLEFPVVVLVDASWSRRGTESPVFRVDADAGAACLLPEAAPGEDVPEPFAYQLSRRYAERRDRAERRRLLYVGATRAADLLLVSGSLDRCPPDAWLRQWLDALGAEEGDLAAADAFVTWQYAWGACDITVPLSPPPDMPRAAATLGGWDDPVLSAGQPVTGIAPMWPPLVDKVPVDVLAPARELAATHLAEPDHPRWRDPEVHRQSVLRDRVLHDAPDPIRPLPERPLKEPALRRIAGEVVHRALKLDLLPGSADPAELDRRLRVYAWEAGLSDERQLGEVIPQAVDLLQRYETSDICQRVRRATQVYREIPFFHAVGGHTLHGVLDVLMFDARAGKNGHWTVLDYKTASVGRYQALQDARRYVLQMGVYAQAVVAKTGQEPLVALYYIHPGRLITIKAEDWRAALDQLDDTLRAALGNSGQGDA